MTHRERALAVLRYETYDRLPMGREHRAGCQMGERALLLRPDAGDIRRIDM